MVRSRAAAGYAVQRIGLIRSVDQSDDLHMTTLNEYLVQKRAAWLAKREAARNDQGQQ
ncbi:hypothetical protein [Paraburkholderia phenoliruptrix]|uniref:hypothetical protein n=1 Tax=Paraburkholderia phenoliruptrix TaxID=252970 RepID=UPI001C6EA258|nr:hypothetical protein [Paraburkholderia phenoliruptrix]MBW9107061.1 hypothetical protein [Paraburkholderia phenoliruptrix]